MRAASTGSRRNSRGRRVEEELARPPPEDLGGRVAGELLDAGVRVEHDLVEVRDEERLAEPLGHRAEALLGLAQLPLGAQPLGDVHGEHEARGAPGEEDVVARDLDVERRAVARAVAVEPRVDESRARAHEVREAVLLLRRADVEQRELEELPARPPVAPHRRVVHREEAERLGVVDPHRRGVALEEEPVGALVLARPLVALHELLGERLHRMLEQPPLLVRLRVRRAHGLEQRPQTIRHAVEPTELLAELAGEDLVEGGELDWHPAKSTPNPADCSSAMSGC
jgi:hypothetical protein